MPIKLECPRCKQSLAVPRRKAGGYVHCPRCKGSLWVPDNAPADPSDVEVPEVVAIGEPPPPPAGVGAATPPAAPAVKYPAAIPTPPGLSGLAPARSTVAPPGSPPAPPAASPTIPPAPPPPPPSPASIDSPLLRPAAAPRTAGAGAGAVTSFRVPPAAVPTVPAHSAPLPPRGTAVATTTAGPPPVVKKRARFITADAAQSGLQLAADGKLPELHLQEGNKKEKAEGKSSGVNPLVLMGVLCLSVAMSIFLGLYNFNSGGESLQRTKDDARANIREFYSDPDKKKPLEPYQILLREAERAHSRGDRPTEIKAYKRVLDLLRAERRGPFEKGPTGSPKRDKELLDLIRILLKGE